MRILLHGYNYAPELTGIGRYTGEMGAWLASRGHRVSVLTAPPYYPEWQVHSAYQGRGWIREWLAGVELLRAPMYVPSRVTGSKRMLLESSFGVSCLRWWPRLFRQRWDVVVAICPPLITSLTPLILARSQNIPFIFHLQDMQLDAARELGMIRQSAILSTLEGLEQYLFSHATTVTTISASMAARLQNKGVPPERLHLLANWADLKEISPGPRMNSRRRELGLTNEIVVLYAGNMGEKQGLEIILASAAMLLQEPTIKFILVGEGAAKSRLLAVAKQRGLDNVLFLPLQSEAQFPPLLAMGDIHLVVQKQKAADLVMPSKLTNILAAGRPFIATAFPETELACVTVDSQAGLLIPPEDPSALAQAVAKLAADETSRQEMGHKGRAYAEVWLDREAILSSFEGLLYQLTGSLRSSVHHTSGRFVSSPPPG